MVILKLQNWVNLIDYYWKRCSSSAEQIEKIFFSSQTHFGFINSGSKMLSFGEIAICLGWGKKRFLPHCMCAFFLRSSLRRRLFSSLIAASICIAMFSSNLTLDIFLLDKITLHDVSSSSSSPVLNHIAINAAGY